MGPPEQWSATTISLSTTTRMASCHPFFPLIIPYSNSHRGMLWGHGSALRPVDRRPPAPPFIKSLQFDHKTESLRETLRVLFQCAYNRPPARLSEDTSPSCSPTVSRRANAVVLHVLVEVVSHSSHRQECSAGVGRVVYR